MREDMEIDRWEEIVRGETGYELSEIIGSFTGQVAVIFPDLMGLMEEVDTIEGDTQLAIIAAIGEDDSILRALLQLDLEFSQEDLGEDEKYEEVEEEFQGVTLHVRKQTTLEGVEEQEGWAVVDGFALMAEPKSYLQELVATIKKGGTDSPLRDSEGFRKMRNRVSAVDLLVYLNFEAFLPIIEEGIREGMRSEQQQSDQPDPMGITPEAVIDSLALDSIQSVFGSMKILDDATQVDFGVQYAEDRGVIKILALLPGPVEPPDFIPEDALSLSVANFSVKQAWEALKEMFRVVSPDFADMMEMQLHQLAAESGFDLDKGIFGSFGDRLFAAEFAPPPEQPGEGASFAALDQLIGLSVTDRQSLEMGLEALKSLIGAGGELFESSEYLGYTIYRMKQPLPGAAENPSRVLAYALTEDHLLLSIGTDAPLRAALSRQNKPGRNVWDRPDVRKALEGLPPKASGLSYYDVEGLLRTAIDSCSALQTMVGEEEGEDETAALCDPEAKPDAATIRKYFGLALGAQYKDGGGFYGTVRLMHPSE